MAKTTDKEQTAFNYYQIAHIDSERVKKLPLTIKIFLENLMRHEDGEKVTQEHITALLNWNKESSKGKDIPFFPARVLLQDFTGVPLLVDLAAMRDAILEIGGDPQIINPLKPMELVVDHSIIVDAYGDSSAHDHNKKEDYQRNQERYSFFKWAQKSLKNVQVVPPHTGIVHQINIEYLARGVFAEKNIDQSYSLYPDTVVGTDSHTTMVNGLGILGWGVGGIEAEAVALGQPIPLTIPDVIGVRLEGSLSEGVTATDLVLTITNRLRKYGVVNKFVEFFGPGISSLPISDRVTIANMSPEFGSTAALFPIDDKTIEYFEMTGRPRLQCDVIQSYCKDQGLFFDPQNEPEFTDVIILNLADVQPCIAGPSRPQDHIPLKKAYPLMEKTFAKRQNKQSDSENLQDGDIVIAAITSCTNTSNPHVLITAGLLAKKAVEKGLVVAKHVKTSLAPGSQTVESYLKKSGLLSYLEKLGFFIVGYGCTTCIGNSGPLKDAINQQITQKELNVCAVLSGNRNFEARIHPLVRSSYLASPPLVVAYALAGHMLIDFDNDPLGYDPKGNPVFLKDCWPSSDEVNTLLKTVVTPDLYKETYQKIFEGDQYWQAMSFKPSALYPWDEKSTYLKRPPYLKHLKKHPQALKNIDKAYTLALFGDSVTTDHISPAGNIGVNTPAGQYLKERGVLPKDFNSYGARRGNDAVMHRGTFANVRLKNRLVAPKEGGWTLYFPENKEMTIFEASQNYQKNGNDLVIFAGKEYGSGSSRDWAAKGTKLLGVKAVIAESYERIHRSNLIGMGVIPLEFLSGESVASLGITGHERISIEWNLKVRGLQKVTLWDEQKKTSRDIQLRIKIETQEELAYILNDGILPYVLRAISQADKE